LANRGTDYLARGKTTWTAGAILLAADALAKHTQAAKLFLENQLMNGLLAGQVLEEA